MKKFVMIFIGALSFLITFAQSPGAFNYQAVLRDATGNARANANVNMQITILQGSIDGTAVYIENHFSVTNGFGLVSLEIGRGETVTGNFGDINWGNGPYFIKLSVDGAELGSSQLLSVPYALYAGEAGNGFSGDYDDLSNKPDLGSFLTSESDPDFNASQAKNITNSGSGAVITAAERTKLTGIQIGAEVNVSADWNAVSGDAQILNKPDLSGYVQTSATTAWDKNAADDFSGDYNDVLNKPDITTSPNILIGPGAGVNTPADRNIVAIGDSALYKNGTGATQSYQATGNTAVGSKSLYSNTTASYNTSNGYKALFYNISGYYNTANGFAALYSNTTGNSNTANGYAALYSNTTGYCNTANGNGALYYNTTGSNNTADGHRALNSNTTGIHNTANGYQSLYYNTTGNYNTANGNAALYYNTTGNTNTALGYSAGSSITTGSNNIAIGNEAQVPTSTASNQVRIGNTAITYAGIQVAWTITSDIRWKESVRDLPYGLNFVNRLKPVDYIRKNNENKTREAGFIAQDVEALLNEMGIENSGIISKGYDGSLELRYNDFIPILTKALQEQQAEIERLQKQDEEMKTETELLKKQYEELKKMIEDL